MKNKMPMQAQLNNMEPCPKFSKLHRICTIEFMLISQIIPFLLIVAKMKGAQHRLKVQCFLVPTNLKKIKTILPRLCYEEYLISLALKRRLTDKSGVNRQQIHTALVNSQYSTSKLTKINPFYSNITIHNEWEDLSEQSDPLLWKILTDKNARESNNRSE